MLNRASHGFAIKINNMKEAVCFSINNYPGSNNDLSECNNDSKDLKEFFENLGFTVTRLIDAQVTIALFKSELKRLIEKAVAGDIIVISYSGHGTQVWDFSKDEIDFYDEALFLYDGTLIDDELYVIIQNLKDDVELVVILDSCFSGTATKARFRKPKRLTKDRKKLKMLRRRKPFLREDYIKNILFSGCSDSEYSYDAGALNNGAFTYHFINQYKQGMTYREHMNAIRTKLPSNLYPQTPEITGNNKLFDNVAYNVKEEVEVVVQDTTLFWVKVINYIGMILTALFGKKNKSNT